MPARSAKRIGGRGLFIFLLLLGGWAPAQGQESIGQLEGEDFTVRGQVSLVTVDGRTVALLASGNELNVRRDAAQLHLFEGGEITFCGPMTVSLLKSSSGLTLAFGAGQLYLRLPRAILVNLYTPQFVIGLMESPGNEREAGLALDAAGTLSVKAVRGSVTLREQLGAGALLVPEGAEWQVKDGRLQAADAAPGACTCLPSAIAKRRPEASGETGVESVAAKPSDTVRTLPGASPATSQEQGKDSPPPGGLAASSALTGAPKETPKREPPPPAWQVIMPPLVYMPETPASPESGAVKPSTEDIFPFAEALAMAKELRLQPAMFVGQVIAVPLPDVHRQKAGSPGPSRADAEYKEAKRSRGVGAKIKSFFRRLFVGSRS